MRIAVSLHASFFVTFLHPAPMNLHTKREDAHQKTPPAYTEGVFHTAKDHAASADALESPSLSLAGQTAIVNQAVLLAPVHRSPAPSQGIRLSDLGSTDKMKSPGFAQMRQFYRGDKPEA